MTDATTTNPPVAIQAAPASAAQAIAGLQNAQRQQDPFAARVAMLSAAIAKYDAEFETESVQSGKRPSFLSIAAYLFKDETIEGVLGLIDKDRAIPAEASKDPKAYQARRDRAKEVVSKFNSLRAEGEPEATWETFVAFLEAKRDQAKLLGHEIRNPAFSVDRYHEMYSLVLERVSEEKRSALTK